ncbi:MAG: replication initiation factor domain-containing protein [Bacilli bacterium]|nr:replication initiation factor domain-containing protein [Bacilli bacterium]
MKKNIEISLDKICICANFIPLFKFNSKYFLDFEEELFSFSKEHKISIKDISNYKYTNTYLIDEKIFFQYNRETYECRIEFNPNKINELENEILQFILKQCFNYHLTRIDIACDLFNYKLQDYNITTLKPMKKAYYYDRVGELETVYIGSLKSNRFFRIYNKAREQNEVGDWWRVELQLRDIYIDYFLNSWKDFFNDILIYKYEPLKKYTLNTRIYLEYLLQDINRFKDFDRTTKSKYKKIIEHLELDSMKFLGDLVDASKNEIVNTIKDYIKI